MNVVYGSELSLEIKEKLKKEVEGFSGRKPCLSVILVGDNPASVSYVRGKNKACVEIGIDCIQKIYLQIFQRQQRKLMLRKKLILNQH